MDENIFERYELKYGMNREQYNALRKYMEDKIHPDAFPEGVVCSLYLDTDNFEVIRNSIEAINYKEKFRLRSYGSAKDDGMVFMEMKKKIDGVVYKRRIAITYKQAMEYFNNRKMPNQTQIMKEIDYSQNYYGGLKPKVLVIYDRLAFVDNEDSDIRITFDTNIRYRINDLDMRKETEGEQLLTDDHIMLEIKSPGYIPLWLAQKLDELNIRREKFSKYGKIYETRKGELENGLTVYRN